MFKQKTDPAMPPAVEVLLLWSDGAVIRHARLIDVDEHVVLCRGVHLYLTLYPTRTARARKNLRKWWVV